MQKMEWIFVLFVLCGFAVVETEKVFFSDIQDTYECEKSTQWQKYCKVYNFDVEGCKPWRLSDCPEPYMSAQLTPCIHYDCKVARINYYGTKMVNHTVFFSARWWQRQPSSWPHRRQPYYEPERH